MQQFMLANNNGQDIMIGSKDEAVKLANARNESICLYKKEIGNSTYYEAEPTFIIHPSR